MSEIASYVRERTCHRRGTDSISHQRDRMRGLMMLRSDYRTMIRSARWLWFCAYGCVSCEPVIVCERKVRSTVYSGRIERRRAKWAGPRRAARGGGGAAGDLTDVVGKNQQLER